MRDGAVRNFGVEMHVERAALVAVGQPGDLRSDRYAIDDRGHANARNRKLIRDEP